MPRELKGDLQVSKAKFALVVSRFNEFITSKLLSGALDVLERHGAKDADLTVVRVPGAFELPLVANKLAQAGKHDAIICLGCVIRGHTPHFEYIASEVAKGVAQVGLETGVPTVFGVITADSLEQAIERAGSKAGNKGADAALAAIELVNLLRVVASES